jgi:putative copper resistance protein D
VNTLLVGARALHYASAMLLFGELVFLVAVAKRARRGTGYAAPGEAGDIQHRLLVVAICSVVASIASGVAWLAAEAASMSGMPLGQALNGHTFALVLGETVFGHVWVLRYGLIIAFCALLLGMRRSVKDERRSRLEVGALLVAGVYLAALAWVGHAAAGQGLDRFIQIVADMVHLLAAGAWLGALPGLVSLLGSTQPLDVAVQATRRFSLVGTASVSALVLTGLVNAWYLVGDAPALLGTDYGQLLLAKLALFAAMAALAIVNRWYLTPRVRVHDRMALSSLRRNAILETAAGIVVVMLVGALGITIPAVHQMAVHNF